MSLELFIQNVGITAETTNTLPILVKYFILESINFEQVLAIRRFEIANLKVKKC